VCSLARNGKLADLDVALKKLKNWKNDGFVLLDDTSPNAFVHSLVPNIIFVHKGLISIEFPEEVGWFNGNS
jgi:hypothetical protein